MPMLVTPGFSTTEVIRSQYVPQRAVVRNFPFSILDEYFSISPLPEMVSVPSSVSTHVRLSPHSPEAITSPSSANRAMSSTVSSVASSVSSVASVGAEVSSVGAVVSSAGASVGAFVSTTASVGAVVSSVPSVSAKTGVTSWNVTATAISKASNFFMMQPSSFIFDRYSFPPKQAAAPHSITLLSAYH